MIVSLSRDAIIEAERAGRGRRGWSWVFLCCETAAVLKRSEPMFQTRAAALRVGGIVLDDLRSRDGDLASRAA